MTESVHYKLVDFPELKPLQGIYSWHAVVTASSTVERYNNLFRLKKFDVRMKGNFLEEYMGTIHNNLALNDDFFSHDNHHLDKILENITREISPPLYIGISNDIQRRLHQHRDQLDNVIHEYSLPPTNNNGFENFKLDTDEESTYFGIRLGNFLKRSDTIHSGGLLVKVTYFTPPIKRRELIKIENFLNRTYYPIFGRN